MHRPKENSPPGGSRREGCFAYCLKDLFTFDGVQLIERTQVNHSITDGGSRIESAGQLVLGNHLSCLSIDDRTQPFNAQEVDLVVSTNQSREVLAVHPLFQTGSPSLRFRQVATPFWLTIYSLSFMIRGVDASGVAVSNFQSRPDLLMSPVPPCLKALM